MGIALGCATARASAGTCEEGESVSLDDPVVTVIEGPGDAAAEQDRWPDGESYWEAEELRIPPVAAVLDRVEQ
jgi:hypothetical protein